MGSKNKSFTDKSKHIWFNTFLSRALVYMLQFAPHTQHVYQHIFQMFSILSSRSFIISSFFLIHLAMVNYCNRSKKNCLLLTHFSYYNTYAKHDFTPFDFSFSGQLERENGKRIPVNCSSIFSIFVLKISFLMTYSDEMYVKVYCSTNVR